jgi:hypothetical protein
MGFYGVDSPALDRKVGQRRVARAWPHVARLDSRTAAPRYAGSN